MRCEPRSVAFVVPWLFAGACALPRFEPAGIEVSWGFLEENLVDGAELARSRSCAGVEVEEVVVVVRDVADPDRRASVTATCDEGLRDPAYVDVVASDVFFDLRQGSYEVVVAAQRPGAIADPVATARAEVKVGERGITPSFFAFGLGTLSWRLEVRNPQKCQAMSLMLAYADAARDLVPWDAPDDDDSGGTDSAPLPGSHTPYRQALVSDRGLSLGGAITACTDVQAGVHTFDGLDRSRYVLVVWQDGLSCEVLLDLREASSVFVVDVGGELPCRPA